MIFNSIIFCFFFIIVTFFFYLLPHRFRWMILVMASSYFYMFFVPEYILILAITIVVDYFAGLLISQSTGHQKRSYLILSVIANVGFLAFFKYYNFLNENLVWLAQLIGVPYTDLRLDIVLPIGLSFHTFQAMSYTIEVYRGKQVPEKHFGIYALYVLFYPQLVAGPIERPQNLLHQFYEEKKINLASIADGLKLMLWGLFKKVVIADRLTIYVDSIYGNYSHHTGSTLLLATYFFSFQIYCDFSGYSDIARGCARVMGFDLMVNFNKPYFSKTISEFWTRWHISLSTWFKDYLYIPLGGNRVNRFKWYRNLVIVFLVSGLWHGANWTFIWWGTIHACALVFGTVSHSLREKLWNRIPYVQKIRSFLSVIITFNVVSFAWIYFRAPNLESANAIVTSIFTGIFNPVFIGEKTNMAYGLYAILILFFVERPNSDVTVLEFFKLRSPGLRFIYYLTLLLLILLIGVSDGEQFIYFQF